MGFYDEVDGYRRPKKKRGAWKLLGTAVLSSILSTGLVIYLLPWLISSGYLSISVPASAVPGHTGSDSVSYADKTEIQQVVKVKAETETVKAVQKVEKAVVGVVNIQQSSDFWAENKQSIESGTGSGVIFKKDSSGALLVTNFHVIRGASSVEVSLPNGSRVTGTVLGADELTDLAVIRIPSKGVEEVAELGGSAGLQPGEPAIAIGNPLGLKFSRTVTEGIISSVERSMPIDINQDGQSDWELDVLQTDAAINPGNSGGALINIMGQVIGINSLKISETGVEGLGFAIPIDDVKPIIDDLIRYGKVKRPYLGIVPRDLQEIPVYYRQETLKLPEDVKTGVVVTDLAQNRLGHFPLKPFDVIVGLDNEQIADSAGLRKFLYTKKEQGQQVKVLFYRDGRLMSAVVTLSGDS